MPGLKINQINLALIFPKHLVLYGLHSTISRSPCHWIILIVQNGCGEF